MWETMRHGSDKHCTRRMTEVRTQQQRATHRQKRNYDSKAIARAFPMGSWVLRYYPPARKDKLCPPWIGPYKMRAPMEWVVGIQVDADVRIFYAHMDDLKHCAPPDPEPSWPDVARGTSIVVSTRAPSTLTPPKYLRCTQHQVARTRLDQIQPWTMMCAHQL